MKGESAVVSGDLFRDQTDHPPYKESKGRCLAPAIVEFPPELDTPAFREKWEEWLSYRAQRKLQKLVPKSIAAKLKELAPFGEIVAIAEIDRSIANGWQGIFPPKKSEGSTTLQKAPVPLSIGRRAYSHSTKPNN
jgi:hypothetical protein